MQLRLKRSQTTSGLLKKSANFIIDARADLSNEERELVHKYNLGNDVIYASEDARRHADAHAASSGLSGKLYSFARASLALKVTIDSLTKGQRIECKDLIEALSAEEELRTACESVKAYLAAAANFNGREEVFEY